MLTRPLKYAPISYDTNGMPIKWSAREKGIDVMIALDLVTQARDDLFDTAVLVSGDSDLVPALEGVIKTGKRVELAAWKPKNGYAQVLRVPGISTWCHMLDQRQFDLVADHRDHARL